MPLDRGAQRLLKMLAMAGQGPGATRTAEDRRRALRSLAQMVDGSPAEPVATRDLSIPDSDDDLVARLYTPDATAARAGGAILYFHGGGGVAGDLDTHDGLCRRLALGARLPLVSVAYRLAPEHPFPAALDDGFTALRWFAGQAEVLGFDHERIVIAGDSAGASLAAVLAQSRDRPPIALQVLICPILDASSDSASRRDFADGYFVDPATVAADLADYAQGRDLAEPRLSPLHAADLTAAPPALVHTAEFDPFRDEGEAYAQRLADAGVSVRLTRHDGMIHYFYCMSRAIPYGDVALLSLGAEIAAALET